MIYSGPSQLNTQVLVNLEWLWPRSSLNAAWSEQLCGPMLPHSINLEKILNLSIIAFVKAIIAALCTYFLLSDRQITKFITHRQITKF